MVQLREKELSDGAFLDALARRSSSTTIEGIRRRRRAH